MRIGIDIVGHLPVTELLTRAIGHDELHHGYRVTILLCGWEAYAVLYQEVTTVAKALDHNFCFRYRVLMEIHTHQG